MAIIKEVLDRMLLNRPVWPKRAVVTSGLPYGNKSLHCGHITLFIHSDFFARFLRDRIGAENVIYQSGTDCYGSTSVEGFRKFQEKYELYDGTIVDYVKNFHTGQKKVLEDYNISLNIYGASAFGEEKDVHEEVSAEFFNTLKNNGFLSPLKTLQFYDEVRKTFLNGRQVMGKCPIEGCQGEHAYADECDMGHQFMPKELINPVSTLSYSVPVLKETGNWYFNLQDFIDVLGDWLNYLEKNTTTRSYIIKEMREFLKKPEIYIKKEFLEEFKKISSSLTPHELVVDNKPSFTVIFNKLSDREQACEVLTNHQIRFRTGKTLTPFRLTNNLSWGVPVPNTNELKDLTFYVWPESLWAQISLTRAYLKRFNRESEWKKWWANSEARIYQFLGEDNIYFYGPAQMGLWLGMQGKNPTMNITDGMLTPTILVANKHTLFLNKKASSSSDVKPPMANELLEFYSAEQIRCHYLGFNVGNNNATFMPKPFNPDAKATDADPVLNEGSLLTNVFNRVLRTLCYTWQKDFGGVMPYGMVSEEVLNECLFSILKYEKSVYEQKFHMVSYELDSFIRGINKKLTAYNSSLSGTEQGKQILIDALHQTKVALVLLHPVAPKSVEEVVNFLKLSKNIFDWNTINQPIYNFVSNPTKHIPTFLEPKVDFFKRPECQFDIPGKLACEE